jgi:pimeloyl-ACP methyl ester carboxylesterase
LQDVGEINTARELRVVGLDSQHDRPGLGVPLLVEARRGKHGADSLLFESLKVPVTGHLVIPAKVCEVEAWEKMELRLVDPHKIESFEIAGRMMPLAADFTTPLAVSLVESGLETLSEKAFFKGDLADKKRGLYLLEPYRPGRIPVVLVHGLLSSPVTWAHMVNDLQTDPVIREKYQFWTFFYPSSQPIIYSAAELRAALRNTRDTLDPSREDTALDQMVLVGHSMGGLLSRLQAVEGGDKVWSHFSKMEFDQLKLTPELRQQMRDIFYFEKVPEVSRVVFLGTPHKGSRMGNTTLGWLGSTLASPPEGLRRQALEVLRNNPKAFVLEPTSLNSVAGLTPGSPGMKALEACGPPTVPFHSIAGALDEQSSIISLEHWFRDLPPGAKTDGVVEVSSALLPGAESELVYPAEHTRVHQDKPGLAEVRRILLEHLEGTKAPQQPKSPKLTGQGP